VLLLDRTRGHALGRPSGDCLSTVAAPLPVRTSAGGAQGISSALNNSIEFAYVPDFWPATDIAVDYDVL